MSTADWNIEQEKVEDALTLKMTSPPTGDSSTDPVAEVVDSEEEVRQRLKKLGALNPQDLAAFCQKAPPATVIEGLIRTRSINFLVGDSGLGKTPLAVQLGICVAAGVPFLGHAVASPGRVLYCDAESDAHSFNTLVATVSRFLGLSDSPRNVYTWSPNWDRSQKTNKGDYSTPSSQLMEVVTEARPRLIIVDPLRMFWPTAETKNEEAAALVKKLRDISKHTGCTWLLTHHRRKRNQNGAAPDLLQDTHLWFEEAAGARALINQADTRIGVVAHPHEADLLMGGFVRGTGRFAPMDLARVFSDDEEPVGYQLLTGLGLLKDADRDLFGQLGTVFRFKDVKQLMPGNSDSNVKNFLDRLQKLQLVKKVAKTYSKTATTDGAHGVDGATGTSSSTGSIHSTTAEAVPTGAVHGDTVEQNTPPVGVLEHVSGGGNDTPA